MKSSKFNYNITKQLNGLKALKEFNSRNKVQS